MKSLVIILAVLFLGLQYKLWLEPDGLTEVEKLQKKITAQIQENNQLKQRNAALLAEVKDLKSGQAAIEEHARNDLGMVKPGEVYYQIIQKK
jgi:cell division protein FtsB